MPAIAMVADSMDIGGAERHVVGLTRALVARGHNVRLLCSAGGPLMAEVAASGIDVRVLGDQVVKRRLSCEFVRFLADELRRSPVDIVHAHMFASAAAAAGALNGDGSRLVVTEHSEAVWRTPADRMIGSSVYQQCAAVIAVSTAIGLRLVESDGVPRDRVHVVPNGIDHATMSPRRAVTTRPVVGFVGRLRPEKGVVHLLRAASTVSLAVPTARFVVVGDGPERFRLAHEAATRGLRPPRLRFLGARPDAREILRGFDVLAVPSVENEGTPLVVLEAIAAGVSLVASRTGGIPDQVRDRREALLVEPGDGEALATAIIETLSDPAGARQRATLARRRLDEAFRLSDMVVATEDVYRSAADELSHTRASRHTGTREAAADADATAASSNSRDT
jgi:glycosyltransferase involved in cell wall biosynthesis